MISRAPGGQSNEPTPLEAIMSATTVDPSISFQNPTTHAPAAGVSRRARWGGRVASGIPALFLAFDAGVKLLQLAPAMKGTAELGYPTSVVFGLGVALAISLGAYLVPRTAVLGAILLTGYLGGAVATHVRVGNPLGSHVLFPTYVAALLWLGLWLRDPRVRALLPFRARPAPRA
jgi:hypothetical protein